MKKRPLSIIILAFMHFIQPLINIAYLKITTEFSFETVFNNLFSMNSFKSIFDFWILFPIGGFALFKTKKWSLPVFMIVQVYSIVLHLTYEKYTWPYVSESPLVYSTILLIMNVLLIIYVLMPNIREIFLNQNLRWWEAEKRYFINTSCQMTLLTSGESFDCQLINLSNSGVFVETDISIPMDTPLFIKFSYFNKPYSINGKLANNKAYNTTKGLGIKFLFENTDSDPRTKIKTLTKILKRTRPRV